MVKALYGMKPDDMPNIDWKELEAKEVATIWLCLGDDVMYHVMDEESPAATRFMVLAKEPIISPAVIRAHHIGFQVYTRHSNRVGISFNSYRLRVCAR
jgi:hypothetical protein